MTVVHAWRCLIGVLVRESLRFVHQRERFAAALVRPLVWLLVFAAGFRAALGVSIIPPYGTYIPYGVYIVPGLVAMIQLFNGMQSSLPWSTTAKWGPCARFWSARCRAGICWFTSCWREPSSRSCRCILFWAWRRCSASPCRRRDPSGLLPVLIVCGLMLGSFAMVLLSAIKQLENFAGIMNFIIFPMFFLSSALYPLWKMKESSQLLYQICVVNPFTHAVEMIRFALYGQFNAGSALYVVVVLALFLGAAVYAYTPARGMTARRGGSGS